MKVVLRQQDTVRRELAISNKGKGMLDFGVSLQYRRPGIVYTDPQPGAAVPHGKPKQKPVVAAGLTGARKDVSVFGAEDFVDSLIMPITGDNKINYLGSGNPGNALSTATRFNAGNRSFNLTHVGNLYRSSRNDTAQATLRIRLGSDIASSTAVYEQTIALPPDTTGTYGIFKLDSALTCYPYEDFWVEWSYPEGMLFPQGIQFVSLAAASRGTFYWQIADFGYREETEGSRYYVNAYSEKAVPKEGWITVTPDTSSVNINGTQKMQLAVKGPQIQSVDQGVDIVLRSNDIRKPETKVRVNARIDQAPFLTKHDTLSVREAQTLRYRLPARDEEGSDITVTAEDTAKVKIDKQGRYNYIVYTPGYTDAGIHYLNISLYDSIRNERRDSLAVRVINTNRAPRVSRPLDTLVLYLQSPALQLGLDSVFSDPDNDSLQYRFTGDTTGVADVHTVDGVLSIIPKDTGWAHLRFTATDTAGAFAADTLYLRVNSNRPPVSVPLPDIVIEAGAPPRLLDMTGWFSDADTADVLRYSVRIDSAALATAAVTAQSLSLTGLKPGNTLVQVTADDSHGGRATGVFQLTVLHNRGDVIQDHQVTVSPNPLRSTANIRFRLGTDKKVHIDVIGMNGKLQAVLFDGNKAAGNHTIQANLAGLAGGNYLLRFIIDGRTGVIQIGKL
jgi:hypothetical protein